MSEHELAYAAAAPLSWVPVPAVDADDWAHRQAEMVALLKVFALLDAAPLELDRDLSVESKELQRIEAKVDLALLLLANAGGPKVRPPLRQFRWTPEGLSWSTGATDPPARPGELGLLTLYLDPRLARPLSFYARVAMTTKEADSVYVHARFEAMGQDVQDWLDRTLFRLHRRAIQARHRAAG